MSANLYNMKRRQLLANVAQLRRCKLGVCVKRTQAELADLRIIRQYA